MCKPMVGVSPRTYRRFWVWVLFVLGIASLWALPALAATYVVNSTDDADDGTCDTTHCSLREAITAANATGDDDTITFSVSGTIVLSSQLPSIASVSTAGKLTIDGDGQSITISGDNSHRVFYVNPGGDLTLKNLTVSNGSAYAGGGIYNHSGTLTIINSTLSQNEAQAYGGGIYNSGTITITNSTLSANSAPHGGAIRNEGGTLTITNSTLSANTAGSGGGISNYTGTITITNSTLSDNSATDGGAIRNEGGTLTITNSTLSQNEASYVGGGIANEGGTVTIIGSTLSANNAIYGGAISDNYGTTAIIDSTLSANSAHFGGAISTGLGTITITNSILSANIAPHGGGIYNSYGTITITNSTLSANSATYGGGGIANNGTLTITNSTLSANTATSDGGGIANGGTVTITNSTFSANSAPNGGAIRNEGGTVTITNSTFSANTATSGGGGIFNYPGTVTITNSTLSANSATSTGGGIYNIGTANIKNSIVANSPSGGNCFNYGGTFNALGVNFATDETCPGFTQVTSGELNLGPLANNGGPTQTHALLPGSIAIDAATDCTLPDTTPLTQDQRGVDRPQGSRCDIGAFESDPARLLTVTKLGIGSGTVTDNFSEIDCGGDCTGSYGHGATVTLTANAASDSAFTGWSGDCSGTSPSTQVTMTADKTCTATFNLIYTLGDVNNDGKINTIDARMAQQHADGVITLTGIQFFAADVDIDSDVDSADATAIAKRGIGLPTGIPWFAMTYPLAPSPTSGEGLGERSFVLALLPMLALLVLRRSRKIALLLLSVGVLGALSGCVGFSGITPPSGPAIYLTSVSMPNGATRTIEVYVQELTAQGGLASLQGRITFPSGVVIQSVSGLSGFVVKAICGVVSEPCSSPNELRFSIVKPSAGGVSNGAVLRLWVQASGGSGQVYTLSWAGSAQAPIVLGGDTNVEITGYSTGNGQVRVR